MREEAARIPWFRVSVWTLALTTLMTLSTCSPRVSIIEQVQALGSLRVATINSPTTYYVGAAGPVGFEYDLMEEFAESLGLKLEVLLADSEASALD
ncbi:MAG: membrane-bound lytic murein transglycosylase MltF, partial [Gammaproteobacteria bacterium]